MSRKLFRSIVIAMLPFSSFVANAESAPRPNIVYIMSDDQGWKDVGYHGSDIKTPSLDKLAKTGVQLQQYYAQSMCTPSRAALMTGRYPFRYGLQTMVIPSAARYGLATDEWLLPQALKDAGYNTAIIGKWHLGHGDKKYWPNQRGFDYQYGPLLGEIDYFSHSAHGVRDWFRNNEPVAEEGYVTELLGQDAVRYIKQQNAKKPFFLYLTFTAPHAPYQAPQRYVDQYAQIKDAYRQSYAAMTTALDDQIGKVVAALDQQGLRDNTLIIYQSDNGGPRSAAITGEVDMSKGDIPADNGPYRDGKGSLYEGGNRVVALANWQSHLQPSSVDVPIQMVDMYPTLVALAGGNTAKAKPLDGMNVWPSISAGKPVRTEVVYGVEPFHAAVRDGDWKLVWYVTLPARVELFNVAEDPGEKNNVADKHPDIVAKLQKRSEALAAASKPPLLMGEIMGAARATLMSSVAFPDAAKEIEEAP